MPTVTKADLEKRSKELFRLNRKANEMHATEDGNFFEKKNDARNHNGKVVKGEVHTFYRDGIVPDAELKTLLVPEGPTKEAVKTEADTSTTLSKRKPVAKAAAAPKAKTAVAPKAKTAPVKKAVEKDGETNNGGQK